MLFCWVDFEGLVKICGPRLVSALPDNNPNGLDSRRKRQKYNSFNFHSRFVDSRHTFPEGARNEGSVKIYGPCFGISPARQQPQRPRFRKGAAKNTTALISIQGLWICDISFPREPEKHMEELL